MAHRLGGSRAFRTDYGVYVWGGNWLHGLADAKEAELEEAKRLIERELERRREGSSGDAEGQCACRGCQIAGRSDAEGG